MNTTAKPTTVLVTGASGYIAGWIVKYLLEEGHRVHATVRNPGKAESTAHLHAMAANAPGTLRLYKADLLDEGSFDTAAAGCEIVMHTASPFIIDGYEDANEALVRPAVEGTRNVLRSVNRAQAARRVVLTSSVAAVVGDNIDMVGVPGGKLTEANWNTTSSLAHNPYQFSKVAAERAAWEMAGEQQRWDLVCINPSMVYGPALTRSSQSGSIDTLLRMGRGKFYPGVPDVSYGVVDVRDVARAHLQAAFNPAANGRYILNATELTVLGIARILRARFDGYLFPFMQIPKSVTWLVGPLFGPITREFVSKNVGYPLKFDKTRSVRELGVQYRPIDQSLVEHFQQLVDDGLIRRRK